MPSNLKWYLQSGDFHFLTFSCYHRSPYLATRESRDRFEQALEQIRKRYVFHVFGYVVMPEHVHLLVSEPSRVTLARAMQTLKTSVSRQSSERPFWQVRYYDFNVFSSAKRTEKLRYIHRNPVTRGLVDQPQEWQWSSFRHYLTGESGIIEIESTWTAGKRAGLKLPQGYQPPVVPTPPWAQRQRRAEAGAPGNALCPRRSEAEDSLSLFKGSEYDPKLGKNILASPTLGAYHLGKE